MKLYELLENTPADMNVTIVFHTPFNNDSTYHMTAEEALNDIHGIYLNVKIDSYEEWPNETIIHVLI